MKLYSYTFPVKIENEGHENFKFKSPYTITTALHIEKSHYVGFTVIDNENQSVDVLDILSLKKYIKNNPTEFTNASICKISGQLDIVGLETLPQDESLDYKNIYERQGMSQSILTLLEIKDVASMPRKIYNYNARKNVIKCTLTKEFKSFIKKFPKQEIEDSLVIPQPLTIFEGEAVNSAENLFGNINFTNTNVDFSLLDLRYFKNLSKLFRYVKIEKLNVSMLNLNPTILESAFEGINCDVLDLSNCDFSNSESVFSILNSSKIGKLKAKNCKMPYHLNSFRGFYHNSSNDYLHAEIGEFDLNFFSNLSEEQFNRILFNKFLYLTCKKFKNIDKLPIKNSKSLEYIFHGLNIEELDLTNFPAFALEDISRLFSNLKCNKLILNDAIFDNVIKANELFSESEIGCDLDFSKIKFKNMYHDGATKMFSKIKLDGKLTPPSNYGDVTCFDNFFSESTIDEISIKNMNLSKATSMKNFLSKSTIKTGINFHKNKKLIPKNLKNIDNFFANLSSPFVDLSSWSLDDIDLSNLKYFYTYTNRTGCVIEKTGSRVLGVNVAVWVLNSNTPIYEFLSQNKTWNYYYDTLDCGDSISFVRDVDLIENKF